MKLAEFNKHDITLRYGGGQVGNTLGSREIYNSMWREYSHATHYAGLFAQNSPSGQSIASDYWWQYNKYLLVRTGLGDKTDAGAQRTGLIEAWGYFAGNTGLVWKYNAGIFINNPAITLIRRDEIRQLENQRNNNGIAISQLSLVFQASFLVEIPAEL